MNRDQIIKSGVNNNKAPHVTEKRVHGNIEKIKISKTKFLPTNRPTDQQLLSLIGPSIVAVQRNDYLSY